MKHRVTGDARLLCVHTERPYSEGASYSLRPGDYAKVEVGDTIAYFKNHTARTVVISVDHHGVIDAEELVAVEPRELILAAFDSEVDAAVVVDRDGDIAIQARLYDEEGIRQVRYQPDNCHFHHIDWWLANSTSPAERRKAIC